MKTINVTLVLLQFNNPNNLDIKENANSNFATNLCFVLYVLCFNMERLFHCDI